MYRLSGEHKASTVDYTLINTRGTKCKMETMHSEIWLTILKYLTFHHLNKLFVVPIFYEHRVMNSSGPYFRIFKMKY